MKLKLSEIKGYSTVYQNFSKQPFELKLAYRLSKLKSIMQQDIDFYDKRFAEIINNYAEKDADGKIVYLDGGQSIKIQQDKIVQCNEEIAALNNLEIEIPDFKKFSLEDLQFIHLSASDMEKLLPFIEEV